MTDALKFAKLDYITIKPYLTLKNLFLIIIFFAFITYFTGNPGTMVGMIMMYATIYASYPFAVGDKNGIDLLYATLPLGRRSVVAGRYIFSLCLSAAFGALALGLSAMLSRELEPMQAAVIALACFFIFTMLLAIQLPLYFALGYSKAKLVAYLPLGLFPVAVIAAGGLLGEGRLRSFFASAAIWLENNALTAAASAALVWAAVIAVSAYVSLKAYNKRQF